MERVKKIVKTVSLCDYTVDRMGEISKNKGIPMSSVIDFAIEEYYNRWRHSDED